MYPVAAVEFLNKRKAEGRIFADYAWGGYLIWKAPQFKTFIDGRMPSWRWEQENKNQSNDAAKEYFFIMRNQPAFESYRMKYSISYVLIKKGEKKNIFKKYHKIYEDSLCLVYKLQ
jgi:hypothetical protein